MFQVLGLLLPYRLGLFASLSRTYWNRLFHRGTLRNFGKLNRLNYHMATRSWSWEMIVFVHTWTILSAEFTTQSCWILRNHLLAPLIRELKNRVVSWSWYAFDPFIVAFFKLFAHTICFCGCWDRWSICGWCWAFHFASSKEISIFDSLSTWSHCDSLPFCFIKSTFKWIWTWCRSHVPCFGKINFFSIPKWSPFRFPQIRQIIELIGREWSKIKQQLQIAISIEPLCLLEGVLHFSFREIKLISVDSLWIFL